MQRPKARHLLRGVLAGMFCAASPALAQIAPQEIRFPASMTQFGTAGLIDMPSAMSHEDALFTNSLSHFAGSFRNTIGFQIGPRLSGQFRYASIGGLLAGGGALLDRSFDVEYRILDETRFRPAVAVGLRDFIGTGIYSGEYVVATKHVTPDLRVTAGLGWGRLGSHGAISSPFGPRPPIAFGMGGKPDPSMWFRGPMAPFGGIEWRTPVEGLTLIAEYSSDAYPRETASGAFVRRTPYNFGLNYRLRGGATIGAHYMHGSEIALSATFSASPLRPLTAGRSDGAPRPVIRRPARAQAPEAWGTGWTAQGDGPAILAGNVSMLLAEDGMQLEALDVAATRVRVRVRNTRHDTATTVIGRTARILSALMPASVEEFVIIPVEKGMATAAVTLRRSDIEALEHDPEAADALLARLQLADAADAGLAGFGTHVGQPRLTWSIGPYALASFFDPDRPVRVDVGLRARARVEFAPNLVLSGSIRKKVAGNLDSVTRPSDSVLPRVRSEYGLYDRQGDPAIEYLTLDHFGRPGRNLYSRVSVGYLEQMFGGVSAELLWKPVDSRLAIGAEINHVRQRAFNQLLGFRDYGVTTGHVSAYYELGGGYHAQLDIGRYLAGDVGATLSLDREFANGWRVGAFMTLTDVPFADFGEGSFDKGLRFTIPVTWFSGQPSRSSLSSTLRPITRDGGARLNVNHRLYETVRGSHRSALEANRGRFWK